VSYSFTITGADGYELHVGDKVYFKDDYRYNDEPYEIIEIQCNIDKYGDVETLIFLEDAYFGRSPREVISKVDGEKLFGYSDGTDEYDYEDDLIFWMEDDLHFWRHGEFKDFKANSKINGIAWYKGDVRDKATWKRLSWKEVETIFNDYKSRYADYSQKG
jgi:hypothetical protein